MIMEPIEIIREMKLYQRLGRSDVLDSLVSRKVNEFAKTYPGTRDPYPWSNHIDDMKKKAISFIYDQIMMMTDEHNTFPRYPESWMFAITGLSFDRYIRNFQERMKE